MRFSKVVLPVLGLLIASPAFATGGGGQTPFGFEFTALGGPIPAFDPDESNSGISVFSLTMDDPTITSILSLELQLDGLTHTEPDDLDVYLIDPFGETLDVMSDRGDALGVTDISLLFNDGGAATAPDEGLLVDLFAVGGAAYRPEGAGGFGNFLKQSGGTDAWILLVIDDSVGDSGYLDSWTLRGTGVPEPMTLSLLAVGAVAFLRRRRVAA